MRGLLSADIDDGLTRLGGAFFLSMPIAPRLLVEAKVRARELAQRIDHGLVLHMKYLQLRAAALLQESSPAAKARRRVAPRPRVHDLLMRGHDRFNERRNGRLVL